MRSHISLSRRERTMRTFSRLILAVVLAIATNAFAQMPESSKEVPLWPAGAPGALGNQPEDRPSITLYALEPARQPRTAVVVCPGGGYTVLAMDHEGKQVAEWLNSLGISAFVLKYRLGPRYHYPNQLLDAKRALRYVRANASRFGIAPDRIGIMGFSAGGHLASMLATHFDSGDPKAPDPIDHMSSRPDFAVLVYPVISCSEWFAHAWSCKQLLGEHPDPKLAEIVSSDKQVTSQTPPAFLFHTTDDDAVPPENSVYFYLALRKAHVPGELHIFEHGKHGVGLAPDDPILHTWPELLANWFRLRGLIPSAHPVAKKPSASEAGRSR